MKFVSLQNLEYFLAKIKGIFVTKEAGKGLSENNLSGTLKANYDAAYTHSQSAHAPSGAQANIIETVKVNGAALTVASKAVDITVPTVSDATTTVKGIALLGAANGAARYGQKGDVGLGSVDNTADSAKSVASAGKLTAAKTLSLSGDATGSVSTDLSANASIVVTLAGSGATAGTYKSVTVDAKGRVTGGTNPTTLSGYGITDAYTKTEVDTKVNGLIGASDAMVYKGTLGTGGTVTALPASHKVGDTYKVITSGTYASAACEIGDMIICITGGTTAADAHWTVVQNNVDGAVTGPASATANAIALFSGTTGKLIANSSKTIVTSITGSDNIPTDAAVKAFVDGKGFLAAGEMVEITNAEIDAMFA